MAVPSKQWLDTLDKLDGAPKVTHPFGGTDYPRVERVYYVPFADIGNQPTTLDDYPGVTLVQLDEISRDNIRAKIYVRYDTLPGPQLSSVSMSDAANGALATSVVQILNAAADDYVPTWRTLSYSDVALDTQRKQRTVVTLNDAVFPTLVEYDQDPILQYLIVTTYQIVDAGTVIAPTKVTGYITSYKRLDKWRSIKIVENHTALLSVTYSEQRFDAASFPTLFDYTQFFWTTACGTFSTERDAFSTMVESRVDISFTSTKQTITGLTIIPNSLHLGRQVQMSNVLNDAGSIVYSDECSATVTFGASNPSLTSYLSITGSDQLITGESTLFRAGIYRNTKLYRKPQ